MDSFEEEIKNIVAVFKGILKGVVLSKRGDNDSHIIITIITEDDENWFKSENGFSNYWFKDLQTQLKIADKWIKTNCIPDIHEGRQYGYKFKE